MKNSFFGQGDFAVDTFYYSEDMEMESVAEEKFDDDDDNTSYYV